MGTERYAVNSTEIEGGKQFTTHTVFATHPDKPGSLSVWEDETGQKVLKIGDAGATILTIDGISSRAESFNPAITPLSAEQLVHWPAGSLTIVGADIDQYEIQDILNHPSDVSVFKQEMTALLQDIDPIFLQDENSPEGQRILNERLESIIGKPNTPLAVAYMGAAVLSLIQAIVIEMDRQKAIAKNSFTESENQSGNLKTYEGAAIPNSSSTAENSMAMKRRDFLKSMLAAATSLGFKQTVGRVAVGLVGGAIVYNKLNLATSLNPEEIQQLPHSVQEKITSILQELYKPLTDEANMISLRNSLMYLHTVDTMHNQSTEYNLGQNGTGVKNNNTENKVSAAILVGAAHQFYEYPGELPGESIDDAETRHLLNVSKFIKTVRKKWDEMGMKNHDALKLFFVNLLLPYSTFTVEQAPSQSDQTSEIGSSQNDTSNKVHFNGLSFYSDRERFERGSYSSNPSEPERSANLLHQQRSNLALRILIDNEFN